MCKLFFLEIFCQILLFQIEEKFLKFFKTINEDEDFLYRDPYLKLKDRINKEQLSLTLLTKASVC